MDSLWKKEQLERVHNGTSVFSYIPDAIGDVIYCDTSQRNEVPLTEGQARVRKILSVVIGAIALVFVWSMMYSIVFWAFILSVGIVYLCWRFFKTSFKGIDYFLGEKGFAKVYFEDRRDNITSEEIYLFDDLSNLFYGEVIYKQNYSYMNTDYHFVFFNQPKYGVFYKVYEVTGSYNDEKPIDPLCPRGSNCEYQLLRAVEEQWTLFFINSHKDDEEIEFAILDDDGNDLQSDAIIIGRTFINILGTMYTRLNTKNIYVNNGFLVIEHVNHKTKWLGFKEEGDKSSIPLDKIGNKLAFMILLKDFYKLSLDEG